MPLLEVTRRVIIDACWIPARHTEKIVNNVYAICSITSSSNSNFDLFYTSLERLLQCMESLNSSVQYKMYF